MIDKANLNDVKNRFLALPRSAAEGLEHEARKSDFEFIKELGTGSFGQVYLAKHIKTKAIYAIKSIDKHDPLNLEEKASFAREVEIMYKLNHPNIVKLYGHFEDNDYCYFIMQYIPKRSVYELIPKKGKQPNLQLIASVMKDLISAVYYLHNMKPVIIHRDIKPENILLDEKAKAYLTDFGWSNYIQTYKRRTTVCGTPLYLPPEMVNGLAHDEKADIWCIGVLLFELTTGKVPFDGRDIDTVKMNILKLNISWPRLMDNNAKDLISKILKLNPRERLTIEEILSHPFFQQFFPNAVNELIKPDHTHNKIFVVSTDDPKTYGEIKKNPPIVTASSNSGVPNYAKINPTTQKSSRTNAKPNTYLRNNTHIIPNAVIPKNKNTVIPKAQIDLTRETDNNYNRRQSPFIEHNNSFNKITYTSNPFSGNNSSYNYRNSVKYHILNLQNNNNTGNTSNYNSNSFRKSNKTNNNTYNSVNTSYTSNTAKYSSNINHRNSGNKRVTTAIYSSNTSKPRMSYKNTNGPITISSYTSNANKYRMSYKPKNVINYSSNNSYHSTYNTKYFK